jgi:hypothetical protein
MANHQTLEHKTQDTALALLTLVSAFLFWRWGVWGGMHLGFSVSYVCLFMLVTAFAFRKRRAGEGGARKIPLISLLCGITALGLSGLNTVFQDPLFHTITFLAIVFLTALYFAGLYQFSRYATGSLLTLLDAARILIYLPMKHIGISMRTLFKGKDGKRSKLALAFAGIAAAVPVLAISGALLSAGDAAFESALQMIFEVIGQAIGQLVLAVIFFFPL